MSPGAVSGCPVSGPSGSIGKPDRTDTPNRTNRTETGHEPDMNRTGGAMSNPPDIYEQAVAGLRIDVTDLIAQMSMEDVEGVSAGRIPLEALRVFAKLVDDGWRDDVSNL